ncbi:DUF1194 domain-containing protein [Azospirillum rugosum]|uniref:VWFA domain-containing protein n=1 Tax=Azospirillum rugosum TaxID=416170 RepID=A0ABS4SJ47_9PROT|nr:DUF1194 domain-containing protein [Azospirillum rugosum]MBP2292505.1 hypothetical protein [Azospirillum rugosum]MDQ0526471.1 hypothetical protein [Azospirillum rugosum]
MVRRAFLVVLTVLALGGSVLSGPALAAEPKAKEKAPAARSVSLELVLAVDGSASITDGDLDFQLQGHAAAFLDPALADAVSAGGVAATLVVFSGPHSLKVLVPWTILTSGEDAKAFSHKIAAAPRGLQADSTALGSAIDDSARLFDGNGIEAPRKVIDLVSNGFSNSGPDPLEARARAERRGVTINALAILDEFPWLEEYYQENVIAGPNCFVKTAMDRESFVEALRQKLIQEIASAIPQQPAIRRATLGQPRPVITAGNY